MSVDEAKGLFALMGWDWTAMPLAGGNNKRGRLPEKYKGRYEVFVNEVMVEQRRVLSRQLGKPDPAYSEYENYAVDRCLTHYAELYTEYIANKKD